MSLHLHLSNACVLTKQNGLYNTPFQTLGSCNIFTCIWPGQTKDIRPNLKNKITK